MGDEIDRLTESNYGAAIVDIRGEVRTLAAEVKGSVDGLRMVIEAQSNATIQSNKFTAESIARMEHHQEDQGQQLRRLDHVPIDINDMGVKMIEMDNRISVLERDKARIFGFVVGAAAVGGGIGSFLANVLGGAG